MIHNFRKIAPNLYRSSAPSPVDVVNLNSKLGIKKIISLDEATGKRIDSITKHLGIKHIIININGSRSSLINLFKHNFKKLFLEDGPTLIHCRFGKDRTGLVSALIKCKYFGENPERALAEARSLGFGVGVDPRIVHLYETLIKNCKSEDNNAAADIVSNEREYIDDNRGSVLDSGSQGSFAPYLDQTKTYPDAIYVSINDQSPTRENYESYKHPKPSSNKKDEEKSEIPNVGVYNNEAGIYGAGPCIPMGGFLTD